MIILVFVLLMLAVTLLMPVINRFAPELDQWDVFLGVLAGGIIIAFCYVVLLTIMSLITITSHVGTRLGVAKLASSVKTRRPRAKRRQARRNKNAWDGVVLPKEAKEELQILQRILADPTAYKKQWGQEPPLGMILYGPSGTGKTLIARTLAQASGYAFIAPSPAELKSFWLGESEKLIREFYQTARSNAPCVVFLDEVDAIASKRSAGGSDPGGAGRGENNATNQLLQEIDGFRRNNSVFTIGATNRLDILDRALTSRLSYQVYVGLPDTEAREKLFYLYTYPYRKRLTYPLKDLAKASQGFSGRDIKTLCALAAMLAHGKGKNEVTYEEFGTAFARLNRELEPASSGALRYDKQRCPLCEGNSPDCPGCLGSGWMDVAIPN